jgi:hypothetical protein
MLRFPVPAKGWRLTDVAVDGDDVLIEYEIELPNHGSMMGAFADPDPLVAAAELHLIGDFETWSDTIRLVTAGDNVQVAHAKDASPSDRLVNFVWSLGLAHWIGYPGEGAGLIAAYWATYGVEYALDMEELDSMVEEAMGEFEAYVENVALLRSVLDD